MTKPADTTGRRAQWATAVQDVALCGYLSNPVEVAPSVWAASQTGHGYALAAYELACRLPGQLWPGRRSVSWVCGSRGPHGRLIDPGDIIRLQRGQETLADLGITPEMPWSVGRLARALLDWVVPAESCPVATEHLLDGVTVGYHDCQPGLYSDMTMWDMRACYYSLLSRAPSPRVVVPKGSTMPLWGALTPSECSRWQTMLAAVGNDKLLRNSLVGCAMGARGWKPVYMRGEGPSETKKGQTIDTFEPGAPAHRKLLRLPGGPYRGLGLLVIRSAYELCLLASLTNNSVYSTIDSVTINGRTPPAIWQSVGLESDKKASGQAHICRRGSWRIGPRRTKPYTAGFRAKQPVPKPLVPEMLYHRGWL